MTDRKTDRKTVRHPQGSGGGSSNIGGLSKFLNIGEDKDHPEFLNIGSVREVKVVVGEQKGEDVLRLVFRNSTLDLRGDAADYVLTKVDGNRDFFRREIIAPDKESAEVSYLNLGCVETALNTKNPEGAVRLYWVGSDDQSPREGKDYITLQGDEVEKFLRHMGKFVKTMPARRGSTAKKEKEKATAGAA